MSEDKVVVLAVAAKGDGAAVSMALLHISTVESAVITKQRPARSAGHEYAVIGAVITGARHTTDAFTKVHTVAAEIA